MQLSDLGLEEKLVEIAGSCQCVDNACSLLVADLARIQKFQFAGCKLGLRTAEVELAVLIPEELGTWASTELQTHGFTSGAGDAEVLAEQISARAEISEIALAAAEAEPLRSRMAEVPLLVEVLGFAEVTGRRYRRVRLVGKPGGVSEALQLVRQRLRRYLRWSAVVSCEPPWQLLLEDLMDGEIAGDYVSTENFVLGATPRLSEPAGDYAELLNQIKEDSGAATRVHSKSDALDIDCIEIAGSYLSKLHALLDLCALLWQLPQEEAVAPGAQVTLHLRSVGPCSFTAEEALRVARSRSATATALVGGGDRSVVIQLSGAQAAVCATAICLCRESERKAWFNERKHGPPALLVDYLSRWFGRDAGRLLRERQDRGNRGTKRGHHDGHEVKRPKTADPPLSVEGPVLGPLPEDKAENQETGEAAMVDPEAAEASSSEETELPSAETLPFFVVSQASSAHSPDECEQKEDKPEAPSPATSDEEEPSPVEIAAPLAEVLHGPADDINKGDMVEAAEAVDMVSDSDSDYYRPGPQEDPLWAKRQEILNKLKGLA